MNLGAQLVKLESATVNYFIKTTILDTSGNYDDVWIGLSDQASFDAWKWSDGTLLTGYQNWGADNPNNFGFNQHYTAMLIGFHFLNVYQYDCEWNDVACDSVLKLFA